MPILTFFSQTPKIGAKGRHFSPKSTDFSSICFWPLTKKCAEATSFWLQIPLSGCNETLAGLNMVSSFGQKLKFLI